MHSWRPPFIFIALCRVKFVISDMHVLYRTYWHPLNYYFTKFSIFVIHTSYFFIFCILILPVPTYVTIVNTISRDIADIEKFLTSHYRLFYRRHRGHDLMIVWFTSTCVISASQLKLWVRIPLIASCTRNNFMW